ncbi:MAG: Zn-ribbon domain-containing OB-fold protein [Acidilobaceae archaeon]|nr:Zn-ribbon domain-containing OB-fold protein [Acidilobaceae archaeon]
MSQRAEIEAWFRKMEEFAEEMKRSVGIPAIIDPRTGATMWYDQRELKLRYMLSIERVRRFFEALGEGKVLATKCKEAVMFPPQADCPDGSMPEWVEMPSEGELVTWTVINVKPYTFSHYEDYVVGVARMSNGANVLAWVRTRDPASLRPGTKVRLKVVRREPEGYLTYELEPE